MRIPDSCLREREVTFLVFVFVVVVAAGFIVRKTGLLWILMDMWR